MKRLFLLLLFCGVASAATTYVSQAGGAFSGGSACNGQTAVSVATYNSGGGNPVELCGTITSQIVPLASGSSGTPIVITFDTGANLTTTVWPVTGAINLSGLSYITVNGGVSCGPSVTNKATCNGVIANTANGTGLANHTDQTIAINVDGTTGVILENLLIQNIYVHNSVSDVDVPGQPLPSGIWGNSATNLLVENSSLNNANWMITFASGSVSSGLTFTNNDIYDSDHCFAVGVTTQTTTNLQFNGNRCHDGANWDTTANDYHHDGLHLYTTTGTGKITNARTYNNTFDGNWGVNNTAALFEEGPGGGEVDNTVFNNVFLQNSTNFNWNNGFVNLGNLAGTNPSVNNFYNNTFIADSNQSAYMVQLAYGGTWKNNVSVTSNTANGVVINLESNWTGTVDYNTYASPESTAWELNGVGKTWAQWQTAGNDAHAPVGTPGTAPFNLAATGVPNSSFIGNGTGVNLTSLGITALDSDINGGGRPGSGVWDIGAFIYGSPPPPSAPQVHISDSW